MKLKVLSALLMSGSLSAFVLSCDEYGRKKTETVETVTPEERAEAREEAAEQRKDIREDNADVEMDLTKRVAGIEKEWNDLEAKFEQRPDLRTEYQTLSRDIEQQLQNAKAQIEQIDKSPVDEDKGMEEQLDLKLDELEKRIDQAEERLG